MKLARLPLLAVLLVAPTTAQTVLFEDTFSDGFVNWTPSSIGANAPIWHWADDADPCAQLAAPLPSAGGVARMGDPDCTFNSTGSTQQVLTLNDPVYIPLQADTPVLTFSSYAHSEGCFHWDYHYVEVKRVGGPWTSLGTSCGQFAWFEGTRSLDAFRGDQVLIRFRFDPIDASDNDGRGWLIDDVRISTAHCSFHNYCITSPNSASPTGARMGYSGSGRLHLNDSVLQVDDAPPGEFAMFFCGPDQTQIPLANGALCVAPGNVGLMRLEIVDRIDSQGHLDHALDFNSPDLAPGEFLPGSNWQFQCWFRDGAGGGSGSNLSDGLSVTFCP